MLPNNRLAAYCQSRQLPCFDLTPAMIAARQASDEPLDKDGDGFSITAVHLTLKAKIPGATQEQFEKLTGMAKAGCPVSKLLKANITLDATLEG